MISTAGFRAYAATALTGIDLGAVKADGYGFQIEMAYAVAGNGGRIVEVPIVVRQPGARVVQDVELHRRRGAGHGHLVGAARPAAQARPSEADHPDRVGLSVDRSNGVARRLRSTVEMVSIT